MIALGHQQQGLQRRRRLSLADGTEYFKGEWMECGEDGSLSPTLFLVEQGPGSILPPHFHRQNEFQLVVKGGGSIGAHVVSEFTLHYAGAYTGYGPIVPGPQGLAYFTIRAVFESGGLMLPESRHEMARGPKRQLHSPPFHATPTAALAKTSSTQTIDIFSDQPDRLAARRILIPPAQSVSGLDPNDSSGVFHIVLSGSVLVDGTSLHRLESAFGSPDEGPLAMRSGEAGAEVLSLRIPVRSKAYSTPRC